MRHLVGMNQQMQRKQWKDFFDFEKTNYYIYVYMVITNRSYNE